MHRQTVETLRSRVQLFEGLSLKEIGLLLKRARRRSLEPGEALTREGMPGDTMFVVMAGRVEVTQSRPDGEDVLAELTPGSTVGEICLLEQGPRSARVSALTEIVVLELHRDDLRSVPREVMAKVYRNLALTLSRRLKEMNVRFMGINASQEMPDQSVDMIADQWSEHVSSAPEALPPPPADDETVSEEDGSGQYEWPMFKSNGPYKTNSTE